MSLTADHTAYQLSSIDPSTGAATILNADASTNGGFTAGDFVSDPSAGVVYAQGAADQKLYTFSLSTGALLAAPSLNNSYNALGLGLNGQLVGMSLTADHTAYQFSSIDPATGVRTILNADASTNGGFTLGDFVSDPSIGVAYAQGAADQKLYTFSLSTGALLAAPSLNNSYNALGLGLNGQLIGLSLNANHTAYQLSSIDPITGAATLLNADVSSSGFTLFVFTSDPSSGVAYAQGAADQSLYTFNLSNGAVKTAPLGTSYNAIAIAPEPDTFQLIEISILMCPLVYFCRRLPQKI